MTTIFQQILDCRSLTIIGYLAEDELALPAEEDNSTKRQALRRILSTTQLDEIYAIAHEQLGNSAEALKLREWLASRKPRAIDPELMAALEEAHC